MQTGRGMQGERRQSRLRLLNVCLTFASSGCESFRYRLFGFDPFNRLHCLIMKRLCCLPVGEALKMPHSAIDQLEMSHCIHRKNINC